jgi:hypothetical protein
MTNSRMIDRSQPSPTRSVFAALRAWSGSRLGLLSIAGVAIVAGLGFNWSWLVAIGVAPLVIGILPCAAMCALGLCMMNMAGKQTSTGPSNEPTAGTNSAPLTRLDVSGSPEAPVSSDSSVNAE